MERLEEAAAWRVRLAEQDLDDSPEFAAWLAADARNAAAWRQVQDRWSVFTEHATAPEVIDLRCQALAHAHEASRGRWVRSKRFANAHRLGIAAVVVAVVVAMSFCGSCSRMFTDARRRAAGSDPGRWITGRSRFPQRSARALHAECPRAGPCPGAGEVRCCTGYRAALYGDRRRSQSHRASALRSTWTCLDRACW